MAPNLIRDCDATYGQLRRLGEADQLSPERAAAICRRLNGCLGDLAFWAMSGEGDRLSRAVALLITQLTRRVSSLHTIALRGQLTAAVFEAACIDLKEGLEALRSWSEHGVAPGGPKRLSVEEARTPVTVYARAGRRFAVIEGGRS